MRHVFSITLLVLANAAFAADSDVLRQQLGDETYERAGISQLSPAQQAVLQAWIEDNTGRKVVLVEESVPLTSTESAPEQSPSKPAAAPVAAESAQSRSAAEDAEDEEPVTQKYVLVETLRKEEQRVVEPDLIRSRIKGKFRGWRGGKTRFVLDNGEVWQQRQTSTFITNLDSPEVVIRKGRFGYSMELPALGKSVLVKKVR